MDDVNVLREECCFFRNKFFEIGQNGALSTSHYNIVDFQKVFGSVFFKPDSVVIIPRGGTRMLYRQVVESLQWLAYISQKRNNVVPAGNGSEIKLARVRNVKVDGYCSETNEVFE
jgi:hypothetical protein